MPGELRRHEGEKGRLAQDLRWGHCDVMSREGFSGGFVDSGMTMDLEAKRGAVHASTTCQDGVEHNSAAIQIPQQLRSGTIMQQLSENKA